MTELSKEDRERIEKAVQDILDDHFSEESMLTDILKGKFVEFLSGQLKANEAYQKELAEAKQIFPIEVRGWRIEPETEPWALKYKYGPLVASNDGETLSGTLEEILTQIVGQTEDYFYKAIDGYKKNEKQLQSDLAEARLIISKFMVEQAPEAFKRVEELKQENATLRQEVEKMSKSRDEFFGSKLKVIEAQSSLLSKMAEALKMINESAETHRVAVHLTTLERENINSILSDYTKQQSDE